MQLLHLLTRRTRRCSKMSIENVISKQGLSMVGLRHGQRECSSTSRKAPSETFRQANNSLSAPASPLKAWAHKVVTQWSICLILVSRRVASWAPANGVLWSHGLTACVNTAGISFSVQRGKPSFGSEAMPPNGSQPRIIISPRAEYKRSLPPYARHQAQRKPGASVHSDL